MLRTHPDHPSSHDEGLDQHHRGWAWLVIRGLWPTHKVYRDVARQHGLRHRGLCGPCAVRRDESLTAPDTAAGGHAPERCAVSPSQTIPTCRIAHWPGLGRATEHRHIRSGLKRLDSPPTRNGAAGLWELLKGCALVHALTGRPS